MHATGRSIFSLQSARDLLPRVRQLTADAVRAADVITSQLESVPETHPDRETLAAELRAVVEDWVSRLQAIGVEAKGLWLVDFDNGEGYYCWRWPEETLSHYHGYDDGFAGRIKIH
jgi:hypothetical protein